MEYVQNPWVGLQFDAESKNPRCLSLAGTDCLWSVNKETCLGASTPRFISCGQEYIDRFGHDAYLDGGSWCSRGRAYFDSAPVAATVPTSVTVEDGYGVIYRVPEPGNSPDGTLSSLPSLDGNWMLLWPNPKLYRSLGTSPFYQDIVADSYRLVYGSVPCGDERTKDTFFASGFWVFQTFRVNSRLVGLGHAEEGTDDQGRCKGAGIGDGITFKTLAVSYSDDDGVSWTDPQIIVSSYEFDRSVPTVRWHGSGDPGYGRTREGVFFVLFYYEGRVCYARSFDPEAKPYTWTALMEDGSWKPAVGFGTSCKSLPNVPIGPNPHLMWDTRFQRWIMTIWPWASGEVVFLHSADSLDWTEFARHRIRDDTNLLHKPLYPSVVGNMGTQLFDGTGFLYYARWSSEAYREMRYKWITIV